MSFELESRILSLLPLNPRILWMLQFLDRPHRSITISQPHFVVKIVDLYSASSTTALNPMSDDFLTSLKTSSNLHAYVDLSHDCYSDSKAHTGGSLHIGKYSGTFLTLSKKKPLLQIRLP